MEIFLIAFATFFFGFALGLIAMYYGLNYLAKRQMKKAFNMIGTPSPEDPMQFLNQMLTAMTKQKKAD